MLKAVDQAVTDVKAKGEEVLNNASKAVEEGTVAAEEAKVKLEEGVGALDNNKTN